jgi:hypothetical protein
MNPQLRNRQAQHQNLQGQAGVDVVLQLANALLGAASYGEGYAPIFTDRHQLSVFQQIVYSETNVFGNLP